MKRVYYPYWEWEDYKNGMYDVPNKKTDSNLIYKSVSLLCDDDLFKETCLTILKEWHICSLVNLTNKNCNRRAWLGQAACSYLFKTTETDTREAWAILTESQRINANLIADRIINYFEINHENKNHKLRL